MLRKILDRVKRRGGQGLIEFGIVAPMVILMILGTIDVFNVSVSYAQMSFFGNRFINNLMRGKPGYGNNRADMERKAQQVVDRLRYDTDDVGTFPMFFFFPGQKNGGYDIEMKYPRRRSGSKAVGTVQCAVVKHTCKLFAGRALFGKDRPWPSPRKTAVS